MTICTQREIHTNSNGEILLNLKLIIQCFGKILHLLITTALSAMTDVFNIFLQLVNFDDYVFIPGNQNDNTLHKHCNITDNMIHQHSMDNLLSVQESSCCMISHPWNNIKYNIISLIDGRLFH